MTDFAEPYGVTLTVDSKEQLEIELDQAVDQAIRDAVTEGIRGILVTRRTARTYTVELSTEVPFGTIAEVDSDHRIVRCPADGSDSCTTRVA